MSEIRIDQDLDPSFSRNSTASYNDGSIASSGVIRYENIVEVITVDSPSEWANGSNLRTNVSYNLLTANQSSFESDTTGTVANGTATRSVSSFWAWNGTQSLKCMGANSTTNFIGISVNYIAGNSYIYSAYCYNPGPSSITVTTNVAGVSSQSFTIPSGAVQRIRTLIQTPSSSASQTFRFFEASGADFYIDGAMQEIVTSDAVSPWVLGGTSGVSLNNPPNFSRTNAAYNLGSSIGINTPRYVSGGIFLEKASTNVLQRSQSFDNSYWTKTDSTVSSGFIAPDGTNTAFKLFENSNAVRHYVWRSGVVTVGAATTFSVYAKAAEVTSIQLAGSTGSTTEAASFDLVSGTIINSGLATNISMVDVGNGWWRCSYTVVSPAGTAWAIRTVQSGTVTDYAGNPASGVLIWGAQIETGDVLTSYIPTTSASVTRNAETVTIDNTGAKILNSSSGAIVARSYFGANKTSIPSSSLQTLIDVNSSGSANRYRILTNGGASQVRAIIGASGGVSTTLNLTTISEGWHTVGIRWSGSSYEQWVDGLLVGTASVLLTGVGSQILIGGAHTDTLGWNDTIDFLAFYDYTPSTGQMAAFTSSSATTGSVYKVDFNNNLNFSASGVYTSEWFNSGIYNSSYLASGVIITPSGGGSFTEYRVANLGDKSDASSWSSTTGIGKFIQYRTTLYCDGSSELSPISTSTTIIPALNDRSAIFEGSTTNLFTSPNSPATQTISVTPDGNYSLRFDGNYASSGSVLIEHLNTETTISDFSTGTLTNVQASGNALILATAKADPTFTRASIATLPNELTQVSSGVTRYASGAVDDGAVNLLQRSQEIDNAYWVNSALTISANTGFAPDGTYTADLSIPTIANGSHSLIRNSNIMTLGSPYVFSCYVKASGYNYVALSQYDGSSSVGIIGFDLVSGIVTWNATNGGSSSGYIQNVGNGWYRISAYWPAPTMARVRIYVLQSPLTSNSVSAFPGDTVSGVSIWGVQLEASVSGQIYPSSYIPTTSASVARSALTGDRSIMIEESSTNSSLQSQTIDNATWVKTNVSVTANTIASPDGTTTADLMNETAIDNVHYVAQSSVLSVGINAISAYIKSSGRRYVLLSSASESFALFDLASGVVDTLFGSGSNARIDPAGNGWYRCSVIGNSTSSTLRIRLYDESKANSYLGNAASGVYIWGVQAEQGKSYHTSYIPTTTVSVNRNAEVLTIPSGVVNVSTGAITSISRFYYNGLGNVISLFNFETGATNNRAYLNYEPSNNRFVFGLYNNAGIPSFAYGNTALPIGWHTVGVRYNTSNADVWMNGSLITVSPVSNPNIPQITHTSPVQIGSGSGGTGYINSLISGMHFYNAYFSDSEMSFFTSTGALIPLDFRTTYGLRFTDNLLHGEGGSRITTPKNLSMLGSVAGSTISWSSTTSATGTVSVSTSIDNGSTWISVTSSGSIAGLSSDVSASGKILLIRQELVSSSTSGVSPSLNDISVRISQKQTKNKNEYIKPLYSSVSFTPTNVSKWQLENSVSSTNYQNDNTSRVADVLTIPSSGIINTASGSVIVRAYFDQYTHNPIANKQSYMFWCGTDSSTENMISLWNDSGNLKASYHSGSTVQTATSSSSGYYDGYHTFGMTWNNGTVSLWADGVLLSTSTGLIAPISLGSNIKVGCGGTENCWNERISQIDIFTEALTNVEMTSYTSTGSLTIPVTYKHSYQMKFENNLKYGMCGLFTSRWIDAGVNTAGTPWITFTKTENKPAGTDVKYLFKASDTQSEAVAFSEDITTQTGRYMKVRIALLSDDADSATPSVSSISVYPRNA